MCMCDIFSGSCAVLVSCLHWSKLNFSYCTKTLFLPYESFPIHKCGIAGISDQVANTNRESEFPIGEPEYVEGDFVLGEGGGPVYGEGSYRYPEHGYGPLPPPEYPGFPCYCPSSTEAVTGFASSSATSSPAGSATFPTDFPTDTATASLFPSESPTASQASSFSPDASPFTATTPPYFSY